MDHQVKIVAYQPHNSIALFEPEAILANRFARWQKFGKTEWFTNKDIVAKWTIRQKEIIPKHDTHKCGDGHWPGLPFTP